EPAGHGMSFDGGDDRLREEKARGTERAVAVLREPVATPARDRLQVCPGAEGPGGAGQHGDGELGVAVENAEGVRERFRRRSVERVFASVEDAHLEPPDDVLVVTITSAPADGWSFAFRPPAGGSLVPGIYEGAGALDVTTTPSRCETTTGRFQLIDLVASERSPRSFAVDFEVRCINATGLLHGAIRYQVG